MTRGWYLRMALVVAGLALGVAHVLPSVVPEGKLPGWFAKRFDKKIQLGLDLQGGTHLVYEVVVDKAVSDKADRLEQDIADKLRNDGGITGLASERRGRDEIVLKFADPGQIDKIDSDILNRPDLQEAERDRAAGRIVLRMDPDYVEEVGSGAIRQAVETLRNRVDEFGVREPDIRGRGEDISVDLPGVGTAAVDRLKDRIAQTAQLEFRIADDESNQAMERVAKKVPQDSKVRADVSTYDGVQRGLVTEVFLRAPAREDLEAFLASLAPEDRPPADRELLYEEVQKVDDKGNLLPDREWRTWYVVRRADLTGEYIDDAQQSWDQQTGRPEVSLTFDRKGAVIFEKLSGENVGKRMAIVLDGVVKSAPVLQSRIGGGRARITLGGFRDPIQMQEEARDLAAVLRAGALPAPLRKVFETQVGPSLGRDAIEAGKKAFLAGGAFLAVFMIFYYRAFGVFAVVGVAINILWILAIMAGFEASLTLPGIAGLVLTMGMAVDANVIINERIREEALAGRSPRAAIAAGYDRAFWTIFDSQLTTAIAGFVLLQYGTGPLRGFAITLLIGILCSVVTGVWVTRVLAELYVEKLRPEKVSV